MTNAIYVVAVVVSMMMMYALGVIAGTLKDICRHVQHLHVRLFEQGLCVACKHNSGHGT